MQCKGCSTPLAKDTEWKIFDKEYEGPRPTCYDNLCTVCLESARMSYWSSRNHPIQAQIIDCRKLYYNQFTNVNDLEYILGDPEHGSIQVEEIY